MNRTLSSALRAGLIALTASAAIALAAPQATAAVCGTGVQDGDYCYTNDGSNSTVVDYVGVDTALAIPGTLGGLPVTVIGDTAFTYNALTSVTIPASVTAIGANAFSHNLLPSVTIPDSVTTIGNYTFSYNSLTSVTIPNAVTTIGDFSFSHNLLTSVVMEGNEPGTLGSSVFGTVTASNDPLVTFPDGATYTAGAPGFWDASGTSYRVPLAATVTFTTSAGSAPSPVTITVGNSLADPGALTADGYRFDGWYDAPTGGTAVTFPHTITGDTTLYAQWEARTVAAPTKAGVGTSITVTASGFEPGESVRIELHSDPVLLATVIADGAGAINTTVTIPSSTPPGVHSLVLVGAVTGTTTAGITISATLADTGANPWLLSVGAVTGTTTAGITISATLADTGANPWLLSVGAIGLVGLGLLLIRRTAN